MKKRIGFVSNSSSSSFICDVCNTVESGFDMGLEEAEMYECENGHTFCISHANKSLDDLDDGMKFKLVAEYAVGRHYEIKDDKDRKILIDKEIKKFWEKTSKEEMLELFEDEEYDDDIKSGYSVPKEICPICSMTEFSDSDLLEYLIKKMNHPKEDILKEIREKFSTYDEFKKF